MRGLTRRGIQVLTLVRDGKTNKEIAAELGIARYTVSNHLQFVFARLGATNRVDAVIKALRAGYLRLE